MTKPGSGNAQYSANTASVKNATENATGINEAMMTSINTKHINLSSKNQTNLEQNKLITDKQRIYLTRARMLQVNNDKNSYKIKIIYTLLALIIFILMASLGIYIFLKK